VFGELLFFPPSKFFKKPIALGVVAGIFPAPFVPISGADSLTCGADNRLPSGAGINGSALQVADLVWENVTLYYAS
jgi:hypothetical protein